MVLLLDWHRVCAHRESRYCGELAVVYRCAERVGANCDRFDFGGGGRADVRWQFEPHGNGYLPDDDMAMLLKLSGVVVVLALLLSAGAARAQTATATATATNTATATATATASATATATNTATPTAVPTVTGVGPQGECMFSSNCAGSPDYGKATCCYDTTNQWWYFWDVWATTPAFEPTGNRQTIAGLPTCNAAQAGLRQLVINSTAIGAEGQTCAGQNGGVNAVAVCLDSVWKCF